MRVNSPGPCAVDGGAGAAVDWLTGTAAVLHNGSGAGLLSAELLLAELKVRVNSPGACDPAAGTGAVTGGEAGAAGPALSV